MIPVYLNVRDRVAPLKQMVEWLEKAGHERIVLIDNDSAYEPMRDYLDATPHQVIRLGVNAGARAIWDADIAPRNDWYVYSDSDIVPIEECPLDAVEHLKDLLELRPDFPKAGLGLHLDDLPPNFKHYAWEAGPSIRGPKVVPGAYKSLVDTTFALYRPCSRFTYEAMRTELPYEARHVCPSWYGGELTEEDKFYLAHARRDKCLGSSWAAEAS